MKNMKLKKSIKSIENEFKQINREVNIDSIQIEIMKLTLSLYYKRKRLIFISRFFCFAILPIGCYFITWDDSILFKIFWILNLINNFFTLKNMNKLEISNEEMLLELAEIFDI